MERIKLRETARSFLLGIIPKLKEIPKKLYLGQGRVIDEQYWALLRNSEYKDSKRKELFEQRKQNNQLRTQLIHKEREKIRKIAEKERKRGKHRSFQDRKHAKEKQNNIVNEENDEEEKLVRRLKRGKISQEDYEREYKLLSKRQGVSF